MIQPCLIGQRTSYWMIVLMDYEVVAVFMLVSYVEIAETIDGQIRLTWLEQSSLGYQHTCEVI